MRSNFNILTIKNNDETQVGTNSYAQQMFMGVFVLE